MLMFAMGMLQAGSPDWQTVFGAAIGIVIFVVLAFAIIGSRWVKVGPNHVLIVSGRRHRVDDGGGKGHTVGFRIVSGGGTFVWPVVEMAEVMSLELMTLSVETPEVYTIMGVPIKVDGIAQIKISNNDVAIRTAAEQFLSKGMDQIRQTALLTVEGHLRAILGTLTVEEAYREREKFAQQVQSVAASDLANMGLQIVSFTIRDIKDTNAYLTNLGRPRISQVKRDAEIGEAEANKESMQKTAAANMEGQKAKFEADTKVAEANRDYNMRVAEYNAAVQQKTAQADLAYDLQKYQTQQLVTVEQVKVQVVERENQIKVQEMEILRKEKELAATVNRPAEAERYRVEQATEAEKYRLTNTAMGQADAIRATGIAEADANQARGLAQAEVIRQQGLAEAQAMAKKADAWRQYNEAALAQMFIDKLPEIAAAVSAPLAKTEKIVIVNAGEGGGGASKLTADVTQIVAQLPPMLEALTGMKLEEMIRRVPGLSAPTEAAPAPKREKPAEGTAKE